MRRSDLYHVDFYRSENQSFSGGEVYKNCAEFNDDHTRFKFRSCTLYKSDIIGFSLMFWPQGFSLLLTEVWRFSARIDYWS